MTKVFRVTYPDNLEGATEEHVACRDQRTDRVVVGLYHSDAFKGILCVPHLQKRRESLTQHKILTSSQQCVLLEYIKPFRNMLNIFLT